MKTPNSVRRDPAGMDCTAIESVVLRADRIAVVHTGAGRIAVVRIVAGRDTAVVGTDQSPAARDTAAVDTDRSQADPGIVDRVATVEAVGTGP